MSSDRMDADEPNTDDEARLKRIEELRRRLEKLGVTSYSFVSDDYPLKLQEEFLTNVIAFEEEAAGDSTPLFDALIAAGISLPAPDRLNDEQLTENLWGMINGLSLLGAYLYNTNHLSDRELYCQLWNETLREPLTMPKCPGWKYHIDLIGSGSDDDIQLHLKYYADAEERRRWAQRWPQDALPEPEQAPFDRDRLLPQGFETFDQKQ